VTTAGGSTIKSNEILVATKYPDPSTGAASSSNQETYTTDALGERLTYAGCNGSTHTYSYDVISRQTADAVTTKKSFFCTSGEISRPLSCTAIRNSPS
jgi:uncharacterized protein RhaS with RHS repeats